MRILIFVLFIFFLSSRLNSQEIWIYSDNGTWNDGIVAFEQFLDYIGEPHKRVYANDLNNLNDFEDARAICFPGGYAYNYKIALNNKSIDLLRDYVATGGSYIGICAGAFFASSLVVWEGVEYTYPLGLFNGKAIGSIHEIAQWDYYNMTEISINNLNPAIGSSNNKLSVLYYGGPYFESTHTEYDTVAFWNEYNDKNAIINFNYKNGKVLLIGPHLEIEENDDRDSTDFANEHDDIESDWQLLESMMRWLLLPTSVSDNSKEQEMDPIVYPNPASDYIEIFINKPSCPDFIGAEDSEIAIYDVLGNRVWKSTINTLTPALSLHKQPVADLREREHRIDISHLPSGVYFVKIGDRVEKFVKE